MPPKTRTPKPKTYGPHQLADFIGLGRHLADRAREYDLIPDGAGERGRWTQEQADELKAGVDELRAKIPPYPQGSTKIAEALKELHDIEVDWSDVLELSERGLLPIVEYFEKGRKCFPLFEKAAALAIPRDVVEEVVDERLEWLGASVHRSEVLECTHWSREELERVCRERGIKAGRFGRFAKGDVELLTADEALSAEVRGNRTVGSHQAAALLDLARPTEFKHLADAGLVPVAGWAEIQIGRRRSDTIDVPVYRIADVEALTGDEFAHLALPWEEMRAAEPGTPSPLLAEPRLRHAIMMGRAVQNWARGQSDRLRLQFAARLDHRTMTWHVTWDGEHRNAPDTFEVAARLQHEPEMAAYLDHLQLHDGSEDHQAAGVATARP